MSNIAEVVQNALLAAFAERSGRFQSIPHDQLRAYLLNSNPIAKKALSVALDAIPETEEVEYHNRAEDEKRKKMVPPLPKSLGGTDPAVDGDENGLVYVTRTFRIDPKAYSSSNYRPLDDNGNPIVNPAPAKPTANPKEETAYSDLTDEGGDISVKEKVETEEDIKEELQKGNAPIPSNKLPEPTAKEEKQEAENADISAMKEEVTEEVEPTDEEKARRRAEFYKAVGIAEDEMPDCEDLGIVFGEYGEAVVMDEAVAMDRRASAGGVRRNPTRQNCETTFENCRAKNPLFCRFHGPRLIELDIKKTLQLSGIRGQVSVTRDPSANNARAFKVTVACRPADREAVETVLDEFMAEPGITSTSERARGEDGKLTDYYEVDEMEDARPRGTMAERIEAANALKVAREGNMPRRRRPPREEAVEEVQEVEREEREPQRPRQAAEELVQPQEQSAEQPQAEGGEESGEAPANRTNEPQANGGGDQIEHFAGGVKAHFSPSEKAAIERAKNDAIRDSNASPNDEALRAYAHSLSHFLGSQNSRYGRRNNALRGIRDDITKAELLEKAEARLAATADADHPERYEGTVKALEKIAELSGLGGQIEIDGATVRMLVPAGGDESEDNGIGNEQPMDEIDENTVRLTVPDPEEVRDAATRIANAAGRRDVDALVASINNRLTGQEQIARTELNFIRDNLGVNHSVTAALNYAYDDQQRRLAERERNGA